MKIADVWRWRGSIERRSYLLWGVTLFAVKYNLDRLISWQWFGRRWSLLDYTRAFEYLGRPFPSTGDSGYLALMLAISLPFMTAGVMLTLKRLRSVQLSPWLVLLFFVPVIKIIFFLVLCLLPSRESMEPRAQESGCLLYTSPSPRDKRQSRMPSSA